VSDLSILVADRLLTLDPLGTIYAPGALAIQAGCILAVGPPASMPPGAVQTFDGHVLLPGLVNTHTHTPMWLFRGLTEDVPRGEWLGGRMRPLERQVTPRDLENGALAGCLELLMNGVTTIADRYAHMDTVVVAVAKSGLRAIVAHSLYDDVAAEGLATTERLIGRLSAHSRVSVGIGPHATDTCGPDVLRAVRALADRKGARVFIHLAQSREEVEVRGDCAAYLDDLGLLAPDVVVAHCTYLTPDQAERVGRRGTAVAHCPSSNAKLEGRVAPIGSLRASGAVVGLGTDAAACNNRMDLFEEMKMAGLLNKVAADDPAELTTTEVLRMATLDGARALGLDSLIGSLEVGKRADVIAVRTSSARVQPWHDDAANLVYSARGSDVSAVWIDGEQLLRDGQPTRLDVDAVLSVAVESAARLARVVA
jgi:5-methylthioadenosine/S-adenosylhomocysteine deaminase